MVADLTGHAREVIPIAQAAGVPLWYGAHDYDGAAEFHRQFVEAADVLVVSGERLPDPRAFRAARVAVGTRWAICTLGARGAVALGREEAGDAFVAGALRGHLAARPLAECLRLRAAAGALAVQSAGPVATEAGLRTLREMAGLG